MKKLWIVLLLLGCSGDDGSDRICAACEPELIGDTGDLGGSTTPCWYYRAPESVDEARAATLGFDVAALESALARPVDVPMEWSVSKGFIGGGPASGYDPATNVTVLVRSARVYRYMRPDPAYCDGTTCRFPGGGEPVLQATCARSLESDVTVEVATADGAVRGTLAGRAMQVLAGTEEGDPLAMWVGHVDASAALSDLEGSLRLDPQTGALGYRSRLYAYLRFSAATTVGELSPRIFIKTSDATGIGYGPLLGVFPPAGNIGQLKVDAGMRR